MEWTFLHRRIDNRPFSLEYDPKRNRGYEPLRQIFEDPHPNKVIKKPAQKGLSELAVSIACHFLDVGAKYYDTDKEGLNVGYIFSTREALSSFSKERFAGLQQESPRLANLFTRYDSTFFKQAGPSYLNLAGGKSVPGAKSFAADLLILDEFDEILPKIVAMAKARLANSDLGFELTLSTPTFPNKGIDALYLKSDQKVWEVRCATCGEYNELDFWRDVKANGESYETWKEWDEETLAASLMHVACPTCKEDIDTFGPGRWTARQPEVKTISGYFAPPLSLGKVDLNMLARMAVSTEPEIVEEFYRSFLGLAYEPKGARVTDTMLRQLSVTLPNGLLPSHVWRDVTMGVDVGSPRWWYRISGTGPDKRRYVIAMGYVVSDKAKNGWQKLSDLMAVYHVRNCVVDMNPETNASAEWAEKHKGRVLRAYYPTTASALKGRLFRLPSEEPDNADLSEQQAANAVQVNRVMAMDAVYNNLALAREVWPAVIHNDPEVVSHMKAPVRVLVKNKDGEVEPRWVHTTPDDYFHTCVYDLIAQNTLPKSTFVGLMPYTGEDE